MSSSKALVTIESYISDILDYISLLSANDHHEAPISRDNINKWTLWKPQCLESDNGIYRMAKELVILDKIHALVKSGNYATMRSIYYSSVPIVSDQIESDQTIARLTRAFQMPRRSFNILSRPKGVFKGKFKTLFQINSQDEAIWIDGMGEAESRGIKVSSNVEHYKAWEFDDAEYILILEKDTLFQRLLASDKLQKSIPNGIFWTSCGMPDRLSLEVLTSMLTSRKQPINAFILTDNDPEGVLIALNYLGTSLKDADMFIDNHTENYYRIYRQPSVGLYQNSKDICMVHNLRPIPLSRESEHHNTLYRTHNRNFTNTQCTKIDNIRKSATEYIDENIVVHHKEWIEWIDEIHTARSHINVDNYPDLEDCIINYIQRNIK